MLRRNPEIGCSTHPWETSYFLETADDVYRFSVFVSRHKSDVHLARHVATPINGKNYLCKKSRKIRERMVME